MSFSELILRLSKLAHLWRQAPQPNTCEQSNQWKPPQYGQPSLVNLLKNFELNMQRRLQKNQATWTDDIMLNDIVLEFRGFTEDIAVTHS